MINSVAMTLSISEQMLFELLRSGLKGTKANPLLFDNATNGDWLDCYDLAVAQGVIAIAWDGVLTLPNELHPERSLRLQWAVTVDRIEQKHEYYCAVLCKLRDFYAKHNIELLQMKGVGLSAYYPVPQHREGGDIDIYTYSADKAVLSDNQANSLADTLIQESGIEVCSDNSEKHSEFYYHNVPIENHKTFLNVENYRLARKIEKRLYEVLEPSMVSMYNDKYSFLVPSPEFNALFLSFHAAQHYESGLALHHLCDWAVLINRYGITLPNDIEGGFREFIDAMTVLCVKLLGCDGVSAQWSPLADELLDSMLYPKYGKELPQFGRLKLLVYKTKRFYYRNKRRNRVLNHSMLHSIYRSVVSHIKRPSTIFH